MRNKISSVSYYEHIPYMSVPVIKVKSYNHLTFTYADTTQSSLITWISSGSSENPCKWRTQPWVRDCREPSGILWPFPNELYGDISWHLSVSAPFYRVHKNWICKRLWQLCILRKYCCCDITKTSFDHRTIHMFTEFRMKINVIHLNFGQCASRLE